MTLDFVARRSVNANFGSDIIAPNNFIEPAPLAIRLKVHAVYYCQLHASLMLIHSVSVDPLFATTDASPDARYQFENLDCIVNL